MLNDLQLKSILEDFDVAYWKINLLSKSISWSDHFNTLIGSPETKEEPLEYFINDILHQDYRYDFRVHFEKLIEDNQSFNIEIRLKLANDKYRWFECRNIRNKEEGIPKSAVLLFVNIHQSKRDQYTIEENFFYYHETTEMTNTGGWYLDTKNEHIYWDNVTKRIIGCPLDYNPKFKDRLKFYAEDHHKLVLDASEKCQKYGIPFKIELKMISLHGREFWVRATGKPVYNDEQEIIGIRGVFQDIDENKTNEINLRSSLDIIASQNSRLFNLAHIVSHNLRSHSSNLSLISQLLKEAKSDQDKLEFLGNIQEISGSLDDEISNLNEIINTQTILKKKYSKIRFEDALETVLVSISSLINRENAQIIGQFDELDEFTYIPEYLKSILLNLITNAIRYRQPKRKPVIFIRSFSLNDNAYLEVSDNGMGIDLNQHGDKMFGMYSTYQGEQEAKGIGLFITKNQVEALGGIISVTSTIDIGTTFKIKF